MFCAQADVTSTRKFSIIRMRSAIPASSGSNLISLGPTDAGERRLALSFETLHCRIFVRKHLEHTTPLGELHQDLYTRRQLHQLQPPTPVLRRHLRRDQFTQAAAIEIG